MRGKAEVSASPDDGCCQADSVAIAGEPSSRRSPPPSLEEALQSQKSQSKLTADFESCDDPDCLAQGQCKMLFSQKKFVSAKDKTKYPEKFHEYLEKPTDIIVINTMDG